MSILPSLSGQPVALRQDYNEEHGASDADSQPRTRRYVEVVPDEAWDEERDADFEHELSLIYKGDIHVS